MAKVGIFIAEGCEEIEALVQVDLLRRAGVEVEMLNIADQDSATGSHGITFQTDRKLGETDVSVYDGIILPGGMPGTNHLKEDDRVIGAVRSFYKEGKLVSAICAAPTVLGAAGILEGKKATCYPGLEDGLTGASPQSDEVVVDKNIITSRGVGCAIPFALALIGYLCGENEKKKIADSIVFQA